MLSYPSSNLICLRASKNASDSISPIVPPISVIMISQRTTSLKEADKIIVMDDGEAVGIGKHEELLESCEVYSEIYRSQMNEKEGVSNA